MANSIYADNGRLMCGDRALTMLGIIERLEQRYGSGVELRVRRSATQCWVASAWSWHCERMIAASFPQPSAEDAILDLLQGGAQ